MVSVVELVHVGVAAILLVVLGFTAHLTYTGIKNLGRAWTIGWNDPIDAGRVYQASGIVEVEGTVIPVDGNLMASPYTGKEVVAYDYREEEKKRKHSGEQESEYKWETVDSGTAARPFHVRDETGSVAVDPEGATISLDEERVASGARDRKYEGRLEPSDFVHVYGQKRDAVDGDAPDGESVYIGDGNETDAFTISDTTEFWTVSRYVAKGVGMVIGGILGFAMATVGGLYLLEQAGIAEFGLSRWLSVVSFVVPV